MFRSYNHVMNKTDLLPGDILLLVVEPTNTTTTHKLIKTGQRMGGRTPDVDDTSVIQRTGTDLRIS